MRSFAWNAEKGYRLSKDRGISFEEIVLSIEQGGLLDVLEHPDRGRYPNQKIFVVAVGGYVFLVPFVESDLEVFLKTIIPSRKATRDYLGGDP